MKRDFIIFMIILLIFLPVWALEKASAQAPISIYHNKDSVQKVVIKCTTGETGLSISGSQEVKSFMGGVSTFEGSSESIRKKVIYFLNVFQSRQTHKIPVYEGGRFFLQGLKAKYFFSVPPFHREIPAKCQK